MLSLFAPRRAFSAVLATSLLLISCSSPVGTALTPIAPSAGTSGTLSGTIRTTDLIIPAGTTSTISGNVTVVASGKIQIDGTLLVPAGARFAFFANGPFNVNGQIKSTSATSSAERKPAGKRDAADAPPVVTHVVNASDIVIARTGDPAQVRVTANPGDGLALSTKTAGGTITISASISLPGGIDATVANAPPNTPGGAQSGGSIDIGTAAANAAASAAAPAGTSVTTAPPASITVSGFGSMYAGRGGNGLSDNLGQLSGASVLVTQTSDGAGGGNLSMAAGSIDFSQGPAFIWGAGSGGRGGDAISSFTQIDGIAAGQPGLGFVAKSGSGGKGGDLNLTSGTVVNPIVAINGGPQAQSGHGGDAGIVQGRAGNGGKGGNGGATVITVGSRGGRGAGPTNPNGFQIDGGDARIDFATNSDGLINGGNGGPAPDRTLNGGDGGSVTITGPKGAPPVVTFLNLSNYGSGGDGASGCPSSPGSSGGAGGNLTVQGAAYTTRRVFNGGNGGDGNGPGAGKLGGSDDSGKKLGLDGKPGNPCGPTPTPSPMTAASPTPTPSASPTASPTPVVVPTASPTPTASPSPSPTPASVGAVILNPPALAFNFPGDTRTVTASQTGNGANAFTFTPITCPGAGSGSITQPSPGTFTVTASSTSNGQTCSSTISGIGGMSAQLRMTF